VPEDDYEYEFKFDKTGEPLNVKGKSFIYTTNETVEVGRREMYDSQGRKIGTDALYANQTVAHQGYAWHVYQGREEIDVLSALHIARDSAFEKAFDKRIDAINDGREHAMEVYEEGMKSTASTRTIGLVIGLAGIGGALATMIAGAAVTPDGKSVPGVYIGVSTGLIIGGGIGFAIMGAANAKRRAAAQRSYDMVNATVTPGDFPKLTTEEYLTDVAEDYNAGLARKAEAKPKGKDDKNNKKKPKK
jgi:hypothetical protein